MSQFQILGRRPLPFKAIPIRFAYTNFPDTIRWMEHGHDAHIRRAPMFRFYPNTKRGTDCSVPRASCFWSCALLRQRLLQLVHTFERCFHVAVFTVDFRYHALPFRLLACRVLSILCAFAGFL